MSESTCALLPGTLYSPSALIPSSSMNRMHFSTKHGTRFSSDWTISSRKPMLDWDCGARGRPSFRLLFFDKAFSRFSYNSLGSMLTTVQDRLRQIAHHEPCSVHVSVLNGTLSFKVFFGVQDVVGGGDWVLCRQVILYTICAA